MDFDLSKREKGHEFVKREAGVSAEALANWRSGGEVFQHHGRRREGEGVCGVWSDGLLWGEGRRGGGGERGKYGNGGYGREELDWEGWFGNFARGNGEGGEEERERWQRRERKVRGIC